MVKFTELLHGCIQTMIGTRWFVMFFELRLEKLIFLILLNSGNLKAVALNEDQKNKPEKLCKIANYT